MSCISPLYNGFNGFYCSVKPISDVPAPLVDAIPELGWEPLSPEEFHMTVAYNDSASVPREVVETWLANNRLDKNTVFRAASIGTPQWWENGGKVYVGLILYSPDLFGLHESLKSLGVTSSFPSYKCHITYGKFRNIPPALVADRLFMNEFVKQSVKAAVPNIIEASLLEITNAKD